MRKDLRKILFFWVHNWTLFSSKLLFFFLVILISLFYCILVNSIRTIEISSKRSLRQSLWSTRKSPLRKSPSNSRKTNLSTLTRNEQNNQDKAVWAMLLFIIEMFCLVCIPCESFYLNTIHIFATLIRMS